MTFRDSSQATHIFTFLYIKTVFQQQCKRHSGIIYTYKKQVNLNGNKGFMKHTVNVIIIGPFFVH